MTILAQDLINDIAAELSDPQHVTWSPDEHLSYLNAAVRRVCLLRPDASSDVVSFQLAAGTKQSIPAAARRLLDITRNMGIDGSTVGKAITVTDMRSLDLYSPNWHEDTAKTAIDHFMYDEDTPQIFYVTPPVHATTQVHVELKYAENPDILTDAEAENIPIDDVYEPAIRHWMLHMAFGKETDSIESAVTSKLHYQAFHDILGVKTKVDVAYTPSRKEKEGNQ